VGGRIILQQEKISTTERSWTKPLNTLQEAIHYFFIKFCIYCISPWYEFFVNHAYRVEKNYQHVLDAGRLEFQFKEFLSSSVIAIISRQDVTRSSLSSGRE
jgi:hypothetical protein